MALITNNISGSSSDSWRIGITGSVRIANPGAGAFPAMPGSDVEFFVSGSVGGKGTSGVSVFGGDTVVSGALVVGTGSVTIDSNEIRFLGGAAKIFSGSGGLTFADSANAAVTLSTLVAGGSPTSPAGSDTQIQFNDAGSFGASADLKFAKASGVLSVANAVVSGSGGLTSSGSLRVKDGSGVTVVSLNTAGVISGSGNLQAGGSLTVAGTSALVGDVTATGDLAVNGGDLTTTAATFNLVNSNATTLSIGGAATTLSLGAATGNTTVNNSLRVIGDLYVSGTTTTIDSTVTEIKDPIVGFGFASGSVAAAAGDRGFIGGITGAGNNVAFVWSNANSVFAASKTTSVPGDASVTLSALQPVRASTFQVGGANDVLTKSGVSLILSGAGMLELTGSEIGAVVDSINNSFSVSVLNRGKFVTFSSSSGGPYTNIADISAQLGNLSLNSNASDAKVIFGKTNIGGYASINSGSVGSNPNVAFFSSEQGIDTAIEGAKIHLIGNSTHVATVTNSAILPAADVTYNLGSPSFRWQNIYTGDLHLRNERGDYTLIEESDTLTIRFNKTGKRYRFVLERAPEFDEEPL
jgi:hypothetical protein